MASSARPSTPTSTPKAPPAAPSPGTWRHPRFDDIVRRQAASAFTEANVSRITWNSGALILTFVAFRLVSVIPVLRDISSSDYRSPYRALWLIRIVLVYNIIIACLPLIRPKDDLSDIPLTPSQRALLGLDPNGSTSARAEGQYITPPRYPRSNSRSGTPGSQGTAFSASPLSGRGSPANRVASGSPLTPTSSPLLQRAIGGGRDASRRHSYGSPSPLGNGMGGLNSNLMSSFAVPSAPSPSGGKGVSVPLNNKWLYERSRGSPGGSQIFS